MAQKVWLYSVQPKEKADPSDKDSFHEKSVKVHRSWTVPDNPYFQFFNTNNHETPEEQTREGWFEIKVLWKGFYEQRKFKIFKRHPKKGGK